MLPEFLFDIELVDENKIFESLSYGEQQLLSQLNSILYYSQKNNYTQEVDIGPDVTVDIKNVIIMLDEFELGLHPFWQKNAINYIVNFLKPLDKKFHIILTSHSPFLLSDIPKQNILFLDKDENGNCKVVDGLKEKKQTFGANIHTLLSDSFFMKDGLMGEFAKGKIEELVNFLQEKESEIKSHEEASQIIEIIGEPILKMKLRKMLDNYKKKNNLESEEDIKKQIEKLQKKLEEKQNNG